MKFLSKLETRSVGRRLWTLTSPLKYLDDNGCLWVIPAGFAFDKRSAPRGLWWLFPPSEGHRDKAWAVHDFERRCYRLLGLTMTQVDNGRFRAAMAAVGIRRWSRLVQSLSVNFSRTPAGDGIHREERYNLPIGDQTLAGWVASHYKPDGLGYRHEHN